MEEKKDQGRRPELVGGGLVRSLGGWSEVLSLKEKGERVVYDARILGGGDFVSEILAEAEHRVRRYLPLREKGAIAGRVIKEISRKEAVNEDEVRLGGQRQRVSQARAKIALRLSRNYGFSMAEIARQLGVCTSAIAKAIRKMEQKN